MNSKQSAANSGEKRSDSRTGQPLTLDLRPPTSGAIAPTVHRSLFTVHSPQPPTVHRSLFTVHSPKSGFTLVEMLAVILIIGIMIAIAFSAFTGLREQSWRAKSRDLARQLAHAWTQRLLVNREFPQVVIVAQQAATDHYVLSDAAHLAALNTNQPPGSLFFELKTIERQNGLRDRWGQLFKVRLDTDYDGLVDHPFTNAQIRTSVIVWSDRYGNPGSCGSGPRDPHYTEKTEDDIVVW